MIFLLSGIIMTVICFINGTWRSWKKYYSTSLFLIMGNFIYELITIRKPLWHMGYLVGEYFLLELLMMVLLYSSTVILYLTYFPTKRTKSVIYVLLWAALYVVLELASLKWCGFAYYNGWSIFYTIAFDIIMFTLIWLHYKNQILAWTISGAFAVACIWWFVIPLKTSLI